VDVPRLEKLLGIEIYATSSAGIGGTIRRYTEDFIVEEMLIDGSKAEINQAKETLKTRALGSSDHRNKYLLCVLVKRNWDTLSAVKAVADQLNIDPRRIQIGGMKDAKAVTAQHITVEGASPEEVKKVNIKDLELRAVGYFRDSLSSYFLFGNSFRIIIRAVNYRESVIEKRVECTRENIKSIGGIPNFFGHQRFGTARPITHLVGKALVKDDLERSVMLFLAKASVSEHPDSRQARRELQDTQDFKLAFKNFPKQLRYERMILRLLAGKPDDYAGAFRRLPLKLQMLFIQAYQSYLFNKFLSSRIRRGLGLNKAEVGDYVVSIERNGLPMPTMYKTATADTVMEFNRAIEAGRMRLALPLIGFRQRFSHGIQGEIERQILEAEDVSSSEFRIRMLPEISSKGELRAAVTPINNFSIDDVAHDSDCSARNFVKVRFVLQRGSYATIVLRELMKPRNILEAGY